MRRKSRLEKWEEKLRPAFGWRDAIRLVEYLRERDTYRGIAATQKHKIGELEIRVKYLEGLLDAAGLGFES